MVNVGGEEARGRKLALAPPVAVARLQRELDAAVLELAGADPHLGLGQLALRDRADGAGRQDQQRANRDRDSVD